MEKEIAEKFKSKEKKEEISKQVCSHLHLDEGFSPFYESELPLCDCVCPGDQGS